MTYVGLEYDSWNVCAICFQRIVINEVDICINCGAEYHQGHLQSWLLIKNSCPICRHTIEPRRGTVFLPFYIQHREFLNSQMPSSHQNLIEGSFREQTIERKINQYPLGTTKPIQLGYSRLGIISYLKTMLRMGSRREMIDFIATTMFLVIIIALSIFAIITENIIWIFIMLSFLVIYIVIILWLELDQNYSKAKHSTYLERQKNRYKI